MNGNSIKKLSNILFSVGVILIGINFIGFFYYTKIDQQNKNVYDAVPRTVSEEEFWQNSYIKPHENEVQYVTRLTKLISDRMLLINSQYTKPSFFENYILWAIAEYQGGYEWSDTKKAVRMGGGYCSQHAIILNNILSEQDFNTRILGLNGHVLNEVFLEGKWRVFDPDFNVTFDLSIKELEANPHIVFEKYKAIGRPDKEARHWQEVFASADNNWHYRNSISYGIKKTLIEIISFYLIWIIPITLIFISVLIRKFQFIRRS